jgi:hypothetical protein
MSERVEIIERLIKRFSIERIVYLILTVLCAVTLMGVSLYLLLMEKLQFKDFSALFVPSGVITLCIFRILKMWDDALKFIDNQYK